LSCQIREYINNQSKETSKLKTTKGGRKGRTQEAVAKASTVEKDGRRGVHQGGGETRAEENQTVKKKDACKKVNGGPYSTVGLSNAEGAGREGGG